MKILANLGFDFELIFSLSPNIFSNFSVSSLCLVYAFIETISAHIHLARQSYCMINPENINLAEMLPQIDGDF